MASCLPESGGIPKTAAARAPPREHVGMISESAVYKATGCSLSEIPDDVFACRLLKRLDLSHNRIASIPRELCLVETLTVLNLSGNSLTVLPGSVGQLSNLAELNLSDNQLVDLVWGIKGLGNLTKLDVSNNRGLARLPATLWTCKNLKELYISFTGVNVLPPNIRILRKLKIFAARSCGLREFPDGCSWLVKLRSLDLGLNELDTLPDCFHHMTELRELQVDGNRLHTLPLSLEKCSRLESLNYSFNIVRLSTVRCHPRLSCLKMSNTHLFALPHLSEEHAECLKTVHLDHNIFGRLPDRLFHCRGLVEISCKNNRLRSLSSAVGQLSELQVLHLDCNFLVGLPDEIGSCQNLMVLTLDFNKLKELPDSVRNLRNLVTFGLIGNPLPCLPEGISFPRCMPDWLPPHARSAPRQDAAGHTTSPTEPMNDHVTASAKDRSRQKDAPSTNQPAETPAKERSDAYSSDFSAVLRRSLPAVDLGYEDCSQAMVLSPSKSSVLREESEPEEDTEHRQQGSENTAGEPDESDVATAKFHNREPLPKLGERPL